MKNINVRPLLLGLPPDEHRLQLVPSVLALTQPLESHRDLHEDALVRGLRNAEVRNRIHQLDLLVLIG